MKTKKLGKKSYFLMTVLSAMMLGNVGCGQQTQNGAADNSMPSPSAKQIASNVEKDVEVDFDKAMAKAKKDGKIVMLEFTGSQWCPPCKMLKKFVTDTEKFDKYAKEKLVRVVADFEYGGKPAVAEQSANHKALLEKYGVTGFPTVIFINPKTGATETIIGFAVDTPDGLIERIETFSAK